MQKVQMVPTDDFLTNANQLVNNADFPAAIVLLKKALKQQPDFYQGWLLLSKCLFETGYIKESIQVAQHAERFDPLQKAFHQIQVQMQKHAFNDVQVLANMMLSDVPGHPRAIFTLAHLFLIQSQPETSLKLLLQGLQVSPTNLTLRHKLIECHATAGNYLAAIDAATTLVEMDESFDTLWELISLQLKYAQHQDLLNSCDRATKFINNDPIKLSVLEMVRGQTQRIIGERELCIKSLRSSLAANRKNVDSWWALADMKNYQFSEDERTAIEVLLQDNSATQKFKSVATFALAKACESESDSMALYHQANRLYNTKEFNIHDVKKEFNTRIHTYSKQSLSIQASKVDAQPSVIFIVGLPRSGSTLVEQILASHSQIEGTIEQPTLPSIEKKAQAMCRDKFNADLPSSLSSLTPDDLSELGLAYLSNGKIFRYANKTFFTDKQPFNFRLVGLIHKILPNAKIIDVRRDPLDCGLSLYKQYFPAGVEFSYNLTNIGAFYNAYTYLMNYWETMLPGKVLRVQYEDLVKSPESQIKKLLEYIGVGYEDRCLNFHDTKRTVHTASSEQVREPINTKGIGSGINAQVYLSELIDSLKKNTFI